MGCSTDRASPGAPAFPSLQGCKQNPRKAPESKQDTWQSCCAAPAKPKERAHCPLLRGCCGQPAPEAVGELGGRKGFPIPESQQPCQHPRPGPGAGRPPPRPHPGRRLQTSSAGPSGSYCPAPPSPPCLPQGWGQLAPLEAGGGSPLCTQAQSLLSSALPSPPLCSSLHGAAGKQVGAGSGEERGRPLCGGAGPQAPLLPRRTVPGSPVCVLGSAGSGGGRGQVACGGMGGGGAAVGPARELRLWPREPEGVSFPRRREKRPPHPSWPGLRDDFPVTTGSDSLG